MQTQTRNPNLYCSPASGGNDNLKLCSVKPTGSLMAWELLCFVGLRVWPWKMRVSSCGSQIPGHSCPHLRWSLLCGKGALSLILTCAEQMNWALEVPFSLSEHDEIRCRHLPYSHVKLQETNPRRPHLYQLLATARARFASPSCSLPRAGNSPVSWFLKCSHLINVTGLSLEICEWNIIVWARKRVGGDELKVYPGLRLRAAEPEPSVV